MGGILAAEVALNPPKGFSSSPPLKHHILGTINFDTPFLGMHPGLVGSGIASLFRPSPPPSGSVQQNASAGNSTTSLASPDTPGTTISESSDYTSLAPTVSNASSIVGNDPNYNPPFPNDIHIKERTGFNKFLYFARKHSDDFTTATKSYFMSHIEFGGCLADFSGLKKRYARIRELEDVDDTTDDAIEHDVRRIRFVNYYTASTGILKANQIKNVHVKGADGQMTPLIQSASQLNINHGRETTSEGNQMTTPRISIEEHREREIVQKPVRINTMGTNTLGGPLGSNEDEAEPAMKVVKKQIQNMGDASGVKPAGTGDDELAPMQMVDAIPIMSDEEYDSHYDRTDNEYHDAQDEKKGDVKVEEKEVSVSAPDRAAPPIPEPTPSRESLKEPVVPAIIRTPPTEPAFPPLPEVPAEPAAFDSAVYEDKGARKIAEKDHKRLVKQYQAAVKDRESAIKDREKLRQKRKKQACDEAEKQRKAEEKMRVAEEKAAAKEAEKQLKFEEKGRQVEEKEKEKKKLVKTQKEGEELRLEQEAMRMEAEAARMRGEAPPAAQQPPHTPAKLHKSRTPSPSPSMPSLAQTTSTASQAPSMSTTATREEKPAKPKKDRRFCLLPNDLTRSKEKDKCWVRVYMEGVDEVGAHCGLFFQGQQYESLVGDVGERIGSWVREDATRRMILEYRNVD